MGVRETERLISTLEINSHRRGSWFLSRRVVVSDMNQYTLLGGLCTVLSLGGYLLALVEPYPGKSLTVAGILVGLTLLAIGGGRL